MPDGAGNRVMAWTFKAEMRRVATGWTMAKQYSGDQRTMPRNARILGFLGLAPQAAALLVLLMGWIAWRFAALSLAYAYAALIFSFLGGLWWGLAAARPDRAPCWVWYAAIAPSLIALVTAIPWATGLEWPGPSLIVLGAAIVLSLAVDRKLVAAQLAPAWWMRLRTPLSLGLGFLTIASGLAA
ncbi:DUF3429 domain-containing protein [Novosphingobium fluoreni]|nr:DUF3429 domain-containing protein [Novosphingobium fluoreni]